MAQQAHPKRVRRGLINVQKNDELQRLTNEFGERDLQEEDMEALMGEDMSFSYGEGMDTDMSMSEMDMDGMDMSFSYEYGASGSMDEKKSGKKGKSRA